MLSFELTFSPYLLLLLPILFFIFIKNRTAALVSVIVGAFLSNYILDFIDQTLVDVSLSWLLVYGISTTLFYLALSHNTTHKVSLIHRMINAILLPLVWIYFAGDYLILGQFGTYLDFLFAIPREYVVVAILADTVLVTVLSRKKPKSEE